VFGELLFDTYPDGRRVLGGAPFNVAWHLRGFGHDPLLVSRIGRDDPGQQARRSMQRWGLDTTGIQTDPHRPTGRVEVTLEGGVPEFRIAPRQAYDAIDSGEALRALAGQRIALVYHGTLALREPSNDRVLTELIGETGAPVFLDVNVRQPWWNPEAFHVLADRATWLKASVEELPQLGLDETDPGAAAAALVERHHLAAAIVTGGNAGAWYADGSTVEHARAVPLAAAADTVGAGDAFSAVCIHGILSHWSPSTILAQANAFAAEICQRPGAVTDDRNLYDRLQGGWRAWERRQHTPS